MRLPRCHVRSSDDDDDVDAKSMVLQCDRKDQHKGFHRATVLTDGGLHIDLKWGYYEE